MDVVIAAVCTGAVGVVSGVAAAWVLISRTRSEQAIKLQESQAKQHADERAADERIRRAEGSEYKKLFIEVKKELLEVKDQERRCNKRCRRLELAIVGAGIPLPELPDGYDADGDEDQSQENPK